MRLNRSVQISQSFLLCALITISIFGNNIATAGETLPSQASLETESDHKPFIGHQLYNDAKFLLTEPDFYLTVGGLELAPTLFSTGFKTETPKFTRQWGSSSFAEEFFEAGTVIGQSTWPVMASVTSWGLGKITGSPKLRDFGTDLFRAQMVNGVLTLGLKGTINRTRPNGASYSYPSGHTSSSFTTAGVVYRHFGKTWGVPAFLLAGYVGLSRLQTGKHYASDVVAGAILGSYISLKLTSSDRKKRSVSIAPLNTADSYGLLLSLKF